ncbi:ATP cone domain-containing protein, partial [uncultured Dubosiella sp.]
MYIKKRSGALEAYDPRKITEAIRKSFLSLGIEPAASDLAALLTRVELRVTEETTS